MSIKVSNLTKVYGSQRAVDGVSFSAEPGRVLGFLGPNGAGKSTTMKMLTTYLRPDGGNAWICGLDVRQQAVAVRRKIGYLPEHTPLYTEMYVREFLGFVAAAYGLHGRRTLVDDVVERVGLQDEAHKKIQLLSKGYRQRVGLAQAIIHDPEVLVLDEPTSGLDPNQLAGIRELIRKLGSEKTVILSTHVMQEVEALCDDVVMVSRGRVVADDSLSGLKSEHEGLPLEAIFRKLTAC
ncbi:ATP-binding cassette domain-containing protein [Pedobacter sp. JY14-1]|uniref:ATP-binding cassette domain-containing protein n=1 Tax=Pedobacter sp. JY14-1 TaxID=3034151 RepID=UPI0023E09572|nr:ATP-binding cassette domain-containing protein [Pedobacter sp. JY14-1]